MTVNENSIVQTTCNSNQKGNNKTFQCECKFTVSAKTIIVGILAHVIMRTASIQKLLLILR